MDTYTQAKWDKAAPTFDLMTGKGTENRWRPFKEELFKNMEGQILFLALGTGLDIETFPPGKAITAIDISPRMLEIAEPRIASYAGKLTAHVMDVHSLEFEENSFDQVFTSCTFCSVPNPVEGLRSLRRVLRPGGELFMFEHTGSKHYPFKIMMDVMTQLTRKFGPEMNRTTIDNVLVAGYELREVNNLFLDVVKTIKAVNPA
jgi:ubiquinone/menaquinone biosynthesis C-methylase UbiE|tara:strand:+ start:77452 stop:78060 length:609 start_codon:yes stop_codon:yes gene_type:complete